MSTLLSGHDLVDVEDAQPAKPVLDIKRLAMCDKHRKPFEYYCDVHDVLCCSTCAYTQHPYFKQTIKLSMATINVIGVQELLSQPSACADEAVDVVNRTIRTVVHELEQLLDDIEVTKQRAIKTFKEIK